MSGETKSNAAKRRTSALASGTLSDPKMVWQKGFGPLCVWVLVRRYSLAKSIEIIGETKSVPSIH